MAHAAAMGIRADDTASYNGPSNEHRHAFSDQFVSIGQLIQESTDTGRKRYRLVDDFGQTLAHVTPRKGLHLDPYVGKTVGLTAVAVTERQDLAPSILAQSATLLQVESTAGFSGDGKEKDRVELASLTPLASADGSTLESPRTPIPAEVVMPQDPFSSCPSCGAVEQPVCNHCAACPCGPPGKFWVDADYLLWWGKGMDVPPLVTTSPQGTAASNAGVLPIARTLFGDSEILDGARSGGRVRLGSWIGQRQLFGIEAEYLGLERESLLWQRGSTGDPILARPFFNVFRNQQDAQLVAYPNIIEGTARIDASSEFRTGGIRGLINLCCNNDIGCDSPMCRTCVESSRLDFVGGYRYAKLDEHLSVEEDLSANNGGTVMFDIRDTFDTQNEFHGFDFGLQWIVQRRRVSLHLLGKVALGNVHQSVHIEGSTLVSPGGTTQTGGLLALPTNIGHYSRDEFGVIPEFGINLGYQVTDRLRLICGYTIVYWNRVLRPGHQIDLNVNDQFIPPATDTGPAYPQFAFHQTDYWAQGLNFGFDYRW